MKKKALVILAEMEGKYEQIISFGIRVKEFCEARFGEGTLDGGSVEYKDFCDPAGNQSSDKSEKSSIGILKTLNIYCKSKVTGIADGIFVIRVMLHLDRLKINGGNGSGGEEPDVMRCGKLIKGFKKGYCFPKNSAGASDEPLPVKDGKHDHAMDAMRYMIVNQPEFFRFIKDAEEVRKRGGGHFNFWKNLKEGHDGGLPTFRIGD